MDPQQELFTAVLVELRKRYPDQVYDTFLPPEGTPYPFVYLADNQQVDVQNKTAIFGNMSQTIHVWHDNPRQRGTVSQMMLDVKRICYSLEHTEHFAWMIKNVTQRILPDNTTGQPLMHGILEIEFSFS